MQTQTNAKPTAPNAKDAKEQAYLYDLYVVPLWREAFDQMVDEEVKIPAELLEKGVFLDAECGTGAYAVDLLLRAGKGAVVVGVDASEEKLVLARGKASIQMVADRVTFRQGTLQALGVAPAAFDWVIADASLIPANEIAAALVELHRVAKQGATLVLKLTTRGSFDEFFSVYWEALYDMDLTAYTPQLEALTSARLTVSDAEAQAARAGWKSIRSVTRKETFPFADGATFLASPLIETAFLHDWLALLPDGATRARVKQHLPAVIDRARHELDFDVSIKATLVIAQK
ncbi:MAG: class I SAM-dependent methyltransferase [Acidobacteria bacterium]|nr:class I SAM-dependent methyltransferase [Acidobacteriota bacterium]MBI3426391.1 class I SAM-dependent methyltransferase [Acidobacteriota bacterium]